MTLILSGTNGLSDVDGSAATPAIRGTDANTGMFFPAADTIAFAEGGTESMRLDSNGNVGIGTSTPATPLEISGSGSTVNITATSAASYSVLRLRNTGASGKSYEVAVGGNTAAGGVANSWYVFDQSAGAVRFLIDTSGNVGIGTSSPSGKLTVRAGTNENLTVNSGGGGDMRLSALNDAVSATTQLSIQANPLLFRGSGGAEQMRLDSSGGLILAGSTAQKATGTTWSNPSDQRLKDNIRDYNKGATELMQVRVCEWEYNGKGGTVQGTKGLGVVADEVMAVLPDTVSTYEAKLNTDDEEVTAIKKFDATEITWLLVKTVQEQQIMIEQLKADVAALKGTV